MCVWQWLHIKCIAGNNSQDSTRYYSLLIFLYTTTIELTFQNAI